MSDIRETISQLLTAFSGQQNTLTIPRPYIDLCGGDHLAALLLSQIIYWSDRTDDPDGWFAKSHIDWYEELAMSEYQIRRATKKLEALGVEVKKRRSRFHDYAPTLHYRIDMGILSECILKKLQYPFPSFSGIEDTEETSESYTKPITETIAKPIEAAAPAADSENSANFENGDADSQELQSFQGMSPEGDPTPPPNSAPPPSPEPPRPNIYGYYEQAFGRLVDNAMLADELKFAAEEWPDEWLKDAFKETALSHAKNWKYTLAILERWQREGKPSANGAPKPVSTPQAPPAGPAKIIAIDDIDPETRKRRLEQIIASRRTETK